MIEKLKAAPIFSGFPDDVLGELANITRVRRCAGGETLFREGDPGDSVFIIESGEVEILKEGKTLAVLGPGKIFGEMALYENAPRSADAVAKAASSLYTIGNADFRRIILEHANEGVKFLLANIQEMSRRLRTTSRYLVTVFETGKMVGGHAGPTELARAILARLMEDVPHAIAGSILLRNPFTGMYDEACRWKEATLDLADAEAWIRGAGGGTIHQRTASRSLLGVPLKDAETVLGYIWIEKAAGETFPTEEEIIVSAVGNQVGLGIVNAYHREEESNRQRLEQGRMRRF